MILFVRKASDGARGAQDRTVGAVGGLAMGAGEGREYGSSGSDLSCALTMWSRRFLALHLPKVTWVE